MKQRLMVLGGLLGILALLAPKLLADIPAYKSWLAAVVGGMNVVYTQDKVGIGTMNPAESLDLGGGNIKMGYEIVTATGTTAIVTANCPSGKKVLGGGCECPPGPCATLINTGPNAAGDGWNCSNAPGLTRITYAICANIR